MDTQVKLVCDDILCMTNVIRHLNRKGLVDVCMVKELNQVLDKLDDIYATIELANREG